MIWSDSCVAQTEIHWWRLLWRNLWMFTLALSKLSKHFALLGTPLFKNLTISAVTFGKFWKYLKYLVMWVLCGFWKNSVVLQLIKEKFNDYGNANISLKCTQVPFTKYLSLENWKPLHVEFKLYFAYKGTVISIRDDETRDSARKRIRWSDSTCLPVVKPVRKTSQISDEKKKDFVSMLKYMPAQEKEYFEVSCK